MKYIKLFEAKKTKAQRIYAETPIFEQEVLDEILIKLKDIFQRLEDDGIICSIDTHNFTTDNKTNLIDILIFKSKIPDNNYWSVDRNKETIDEYLTPVLNWYSIIAEELPIIISKLKEIAVINSFDHDNNITFHLAKKV